MGKVTKEDSRGPDSKKSYESLRELWYVAEARGMWWLALLCRMMWLV